MTQLRQETVRGVVWNGGAQVAQQVIQFGSSVVLARLLVPAEFGLVAMIAVFSGFAQLFVDFGLGAALVQRKEVEERHLSSAFWLNVAAGVGLTAAMAAAAPGLAALYGQPELVRLTLLLAPTFAISSTMAVQTALLMRALNFRRLSSVRIAGVAVGSGVAIGAAAAGAGAVSLVLQSLAAAAAQAVGLWLLTDWHPRLTIDREAVRELWRFGGNLAGFQAVNYWDRNADNLLIGRFVGANALGIYNRAYTTMLLPVNQVYTVVTRVMFPALSRIQDDRERVKRAYLRALGIVSLVTFPLLIGLIVVAKPFLLTLYGPRWSPAVPILQILCVAALVISLSTTVGWIFQSQGRTDWMFRLGVGGTAVTIAAFAIGIQWGVKGIAIAFVVRTILLAYFAFTIPGRLIGMRFAEVARALRGVLAISLVMGGAVWLAGLALPQGWSPASELAVQVGVGAVVYVGLARALWLEPYRDLRVVASDVRPARWRRQRSTLRVQPR